MSNYDVITWRGHKFDRITVAAIEDAEELLGHQLGVTQGSYNKGGVSQSAGTHDGGGVVDFAIGKTPSRDVRVLRSVGFAAWHRTPDQGPWGEHIHAVLIGNKNLAPVAARQVDAYKAGRDGLVSNARDNTWRPDPIPTFTLQEDDMPNYRDWSIEDKKALAKDIADAVWAKKVPTDDAPQGRYISNIAAKLYNRTFPKK